MGYILYIDESCGDDDRYIVMVGLIIPIKNWKKIDNFITALKVNFLSNSSINLKAIRRKNYDPKAHEIWDKLALEQKEKFNEQFYGCVCDQENTVITALIDKEKMRIKDNKNLLFYLAYSFIIQRYQYFLSEKGEFGLVIMDSADNKEIHGLQKWHEEFLSNGVTIDQTNSIPTYERIDMIYEKLIFENDDNNNLLQIADMLAAAISGKYNRNKDKWFNKVEPIIRKSSSGKIDGYGIKIFPT